MCIIGRYSSLILIVGLGVNAAGLIGASELCVCWNKACVLIYVHTNVKVWI